MMVIFCLLSAQGRGIGGERDERPSESCLSPQGGRTNQQSLQQQGGEWRVYRDVIK